MGKWGNGGWDGSGEWRSEEVGWIQDSLLRVRVRPFPWNFEEMPFKKSNVNLGVREKIIFPQYYDHPLMTLSHSLFSLNWSRM